MRRCGRRTPQTASTGRPRRRRRSSGRARVRPRRRRCCRAPGRMSAKRLRRCLARAADAPPLAHPAESNRSSRGGRYPAQAAGRGGKGGAAAAQGGLWRGQQRGSLRCWCATGVAQGPVGPRRGGQRASRAKVHLWSGAPAAPAVLNPSAQPIHPAAAAGRCLQAGDRAAAPLDLLPHPAGRFSRLGTHLIFQHAAAGVLVHERAARGARQRARHCHSACRREGAVCCRPWVALCLLFCARPARTSDSTCMVHPWRRDHHASSGQEEHKSSMTAAHC